MYQSKRLQNRPFDGSKSKQISRLTLITLEEASVPYPLVLTFSCIVYYKNENSSDISLL